MKELFSEENKVTEYCLKLERWQGPPQVKQYEIVLSFKVSLFIQFTQPWKWGEFVNLVCLGRKRFFFFSSG